MLRIMGICLIAAGCVGLGFQKSRDITARCRELELLLHMLMVLKGEIRYGNAALCEALENTADKLPGIYRRFLQGTAVQMKKNENRSFGEIFRECAEEFLGSLHLEREEREFFYSLGDHLGYLDREMQMKQLEIYEMELARRLERLRMELPEKTKLYRNLGILGGAALAVMMW